MKINASSIYTENVLSDIYYFKMAVLLAVDCRKK